MLLLLDMGTRWAISPGDVLDIHKTTAVSKETRHTYKRGKHRTQDSSSDPSSATAITAATASSSASTTTTTIASP